MLQNRRLTTWPQLCILATATAASCTWPSLIACKTSDSESGLVEGRGTPSYSPPPVSKDDPRVVEVEGKLHRHDSTSIPPKNPPPPAKVRVGLGSGRPDETNGVCRLYAPKLPEPICCSRNYGLSEARVRELCGHDIYLGESARKSCGYFFIHNMDEPTPTSARMSFVSAESPAAAAALHDAVNQRRLKRPDFRSTPVPGVEGALWSEDEGYHWAFLPGWDKVRQISWLDGFCSDEAMAKLIAEITQAPQPGPDWQRDSLTPGGPAKSSPDASASKPEPAGTQRGR